MRDEQNHQQGFTLVSDAVLHAVDQLTDRVTRLEVSVHMLHQALQAYALAMDPVRATRPEEDKT
jgi:hypothetical protein